jgi:isoquinoline 1-oxidoreductase beta subunit
MSPPLPRPRPSRRALLAAGGAAAGLLTVGFSVSGCGASPAAEQRFAPNGFVRIDAEGKVTLVIPQVEMGQGTYTSLAMILAEELDAAWESVQVAHAPADERLYRNPLLTFQGTGNSNSVRAFWTPLRKAGAAARAVLVAAAAQAWEVPPETCRTEAGFVNHPSTGRRKAYGALTAAAAKLEVPADPPLKDPGAFRLVGRSLRRLDTPEKVNGRAVFGIDAHPPGVRIATLAQSPVLGGKLRGFDEAAARRTQGVRQVVALEDLAAVLGDHMWAARQGLQALAPTWDDGPNGAVSTDQIWARLRKASLREGALARVVGDTQSRLQGPGVLNAAYELPLLAHACLEPLNCTVHVRRGEAEVWIGTQVMARVRDAVAAAAGLPPEKVTVHNHLIGGGFGRRLEPDMAFTAARIAKAVDGPVKVIWTREEDIQHDIYRPAYRDVLSARLEDGRISAWKHRIAGSSVLARFLPPAFAKGVDPDAVDAGADLPYAIPNLRVEFVREEPPGVRTGFWRGVGPNNNVFAIESFMDELARGSGQDPAAFRRAHLNHNPRLRDALDLVLAKAQWGKPLPPRVGQGLAVQSAFGSYMATVVEAEVDPRGEVQLRRATVAVDPGLAINPDTIEAQVQGGLVFGFGAALYGEVTLENGRVQQSNFHDYPVLRMHETPPIGVHLIRSAEAPGGIGEAGTVAATPALRNAIYAATGVPLRRMPVDRTLLAARNA